jgi:Domain of unknown function (DUF4388)
LENIERTQFVVLTGHLDDQSLPDIIRTLRVQRKSGRLQVEYPDTPGAFFFEDGQMVAAQLGTLRDVEALYAALDLRGAAFNFNPLVRPPERSIDQQGQKFISDLVEVPRREALSEINVARDELTLQTARSPAPQNAPLQLAPMPAELMAPVVQRLAAVEAAIVTTSRRFSRERLVYTLIISFLVGLIMVTVLQVAYGPFLRTPASATNAARQELQPNETNGAAVGAGTQPATTTTPVNQAQQGATPNQAQPQGATAAIMNDASTTDGDASVRSGYVVNIRMRVKNGQVLGARVLNARPGASAYEAVALKLAMQRRYPDDFTGGDTLRIVVQP